MRGVLILLLSSILLGLLVSPAIGMKRSMLRVDLPPSATGGGRDVVAVWRFDTGSNNSVPMDLGTEFEAFRNGISLGVVTVPVSVDPGPGSAVCAPPACSDPCATATVDGVAQTLVCDTGLCECWSEPIGTLVAPGVPMLHGDEIMVLLRPAPGAVPDPDPTDDGGVLVFGGWDRRLRELRMIPVAGAPEFYDLEVDFFVELTGASGVPYDVNTEVVVTGPYGGGAYHPDQMHVVQGFSVECSGSCPGGGTPGAPCGELRLDGGLEPISCYARATDCACRTRLITGTIPSVHLMPPDEIDVFLGPFGGAVPEIHTGSDSARVTFGGWDRRVSRLDLIPDPTGAYDVRITHHRDLAGTASIPVDLGTEVEIRVNGAPAGQAVSEDCIIWDIMNSGGNGSPGIQATAMSCGTATRITTGEVIPLQIDPQAGVCTMPSILTAFSGVPLSPGDEIMVLLRPAPGALPELPEAPGEENDTLRLTLRASDVPGPGLSELRLFPAAPNPSRVGAVIAFSMAGPGRAVLRIVNARGGLVRTLWDGTAPAGRQEVAWDGRDTRGERVAPGVYLLSLQAKGERRADKLVVLR